LRRRRTLRDAEFFGFLLAVKALAKVQICLSYPRKEDALCVLLPPSMLVLD